MYVMFAGVNIHIIIIKPTHDKTYNKTCLAKDSDQLVHPPSVAIVLVYLSLDSLEVVAQVLL